MQHCKLGKLEDQQKVTEYLSRGFDVNTVSEDGRWSGLTHAAWNNCGAILELLLSQPDIKINLTVDAVSVHRGYQYTALMFACHAGNSAIVSRLVQESTLDVNYQDNNGETAPRLACSKGHTECVRILAGTDKVDWNKTDGRCRTPLYWALEKGHSEIVDIIVRQPNIDYNIQTKRGQTLAKVAVLEAGVKCMEILTALEKFDCWNIPDDEGDTAIMMALKSNRQKTARVLAQCPRVDLNVRDSDSCTVAHVALKRGAFKFLETLFAQERWQGEGGATLLSYVSKYHGEDMVQTLVAHGLVDLSVRDEGGWSLLFRAIRWKKMGEKNVVCSAKSNNLFS